MFQNASQYTLVMKKRLAYLLLLQILMNLKNEFEYHQIPYMRCVARFVISHYLAFAWSLGRMQIHANAFSSFTSSFLHIFF